MSRVVESLTIIGDLHLRSDNPRSRIDNYADTTIAKIHTLLQLCKDKNYKDVAILGDIFHSPNQPISYLYRVIDAFKEFKRNGIHVYAIGGNHDFTYGKTENLCKSSLGILFSSGALKELSYEPLIAKVGYTIGLHGFHYDADIMPIPIDGGKDLVNIAIMHRYYEFGHSDKSLTSADLDSLNYDIYATGHEHNPHELLKGLKWYLMRPGRLMRGTSDDYNLEDQNVYVDTVFFGGTEDAPEFRFARDIVDVKPAIEVFTTLALVKDTSTKFLLNLSNQVDELLDKMDITGGSENTVFTVLDDLNIDVRIKDKLNYYLNKRGLFRNSTDDL